jgi:RNA polymerase sigma factor (sigma-70 family)
MHPETHDNAALVDALVDHHRRFLGFLEARVESRAVAEEILQDAFVKALKKGDQLRDDESAVAWFYRLLRNAVIDHYRARGAERRMKDAQPTDAAFEQELERVVCACVDGLVPTLKPEYAAIVRSVDLEQRPIVDVARELGLTAGNARVRLHRARKALKERLEESCATCAEHGCLDCSCA